MTPIKKYATQASAFSAVATSIIDEKTLQAKSAIDVNFDWQTFPELNKTAQVKQLPEMLFAGVEL